MGVILRFSGSYNLAALVVKFYTWSKYSHVETIMDDYVDTETSLYGALPTTGVNYRTLSSTQGDFYEDYMVELSSFKKNLYYQKLLSQRGKPYDFTALAAMVFHRDWDSNHSAWFCSELVAWAFSEIGTPLLRTEHLNRITPENLLMSPLLKRI